ncbi:MAG: YdcF family protein [Pseudomonadota bacterium]
MTPFNLRRKIFSTLILVFCVWFIGLKWFESQIPQNIKSLPEHSADAIVILTGGSGRLEYALRLMAENKSGILFISGAGKDVTLDDVIRQAQNDIRGKINRQNIILGHQGENTIGNAEEIKGWIEKTSYRKIILVTSSYHMPRSLLELSTTMPEVSITTAPVITDDNEMLLSEYHKYIASKLRHIFISVTQSK